MKRFIVPLLLVLVILIFFGRLAFTNLILGRGDALLYFYPLWDYRDALLRGGGLPLWNPFLFMGAPFLANPQTGVLYPLNWLFIFLDAPSAFKYSAILHLIIAAWGVYLLARKAFGQSALAAFFAATVFALSGYLSAQIEHINQLQALAWLPWQLWAVSEGLKRTTDDGRQTTVKSSSTVYWLLFTVFSALQFLAGHTQSTFIALSGVLLYALVLALRSSRNTLHATRSLLPLLPSLLLFALLISAQLLPTLELSRESMRSGGLAWAEAVSFSLDPRLIGRALLPGYTHTLFSEFVASPGVFALLLAALGTSRLPKSWRLRKSAEAVALLALGILGLAFALGAYDPLYAGLAFLPPFNLFRAPARWLILLVLAIALFAGEGIDALRRGDSVSRRQLAFIFGIPILLGLSIPFSAALIPAGESGPLGYPAWRDWIGWLIPVILFAVALSPLRFRKAEGLVGLALLELFLAAQGLSYNHPTAPEAYSTVRPAQTQFLISHETPPPRFLSLSQLQFDPGDLAELKIEWENQLAPDAFYDYLVASKHKEVLSPNLPLTWRVPSVDGYDGGVLPLRHYSEFTQLLAGQRTDDGRLREILTTAPDAKWLALINARYLIADKINDAWSDDVFYDRQFSLTLAAGEAAQIAYVPPFEATALGLVTDSLFGEVQITFSGGVSVTQFITGPRMPFGRAATPIEITLIGPLMVQGASLIDERANVFQSLTLGPYRLIHSGEVKIYDLLNVLPRAFIAPNFFFTDDVVSALQNTSAPLTQTVYLNDPPAFDDVQPAPSQYAPATITEYTPEHVVISVTGSGYLFLSDAFYPGWVATVDGQPAHIYRADVMFRAVKLLNDGEHRIEFRFAPMSVTLGLWLSGISWVGTLMALVILGVKRGTQMNAEKA